MSLRSKHVLSLAGTALLASLALTACGSDSTDTTDGSSEPAAETNGVEALTADEILQEASDALESVASVRISGDISQDGQQTSIDMQFSNEGEGSATGTLSVGEDSITLLVVDGQVYFSAEVSFWESQGLPPAFLDSVEGKYVEVPSTDESFGAFTDFGELTDELLTPEGDVTKGEESTVGDMPVIQLIDAKDGGVLSIALEGEPLPVRISSEEGGEINFTEWNEPVTVEAPPADDIVDLESLTG